MAVHLQTAPTPPLGFTTSGALSFNGPSSELGIPRLCSQSPKDDPGLTWDDHSVVDTWLGCSALTDDWVLGEGR
jgi:hypothetical protein